MSQQIARPSEGAHPSDRVYDLVRAALSGESRSTALDEERNNPATASALGEREATVARTQVDRRSEVG